MTSVRRFLLSGEGWPYLLVPFIPIAVVLRLVEATPTVIFVTAALGVIPTAALMGKATEELAHRSGPGIGGLLNVTFGNAPELIIALFALAAGLQEVVKASIIGSVLGNLLLVLGGSMIYGGIGRERQQFHPTAVTAQMSMLLLAGAAMVLPTVFVLIHGGGLPQVGQEIAHYSGETRTMSDVVAVILLLSYGAGLLFSLKTHRNLFNPTGQSGDDDASHEGGVGGGAGAGVSGVGVAPGAAGVGSQEAVGGGEAGAAGVGAVGVGSDAAVGDGEAAGAGGVAAVGGEAADEPWTVRKSVLTLAIAGVAVGVMSEILVGSLEEAAEGLGLSPFFIGLIVVAIVGNAAEHWVALYFARKDQMDLTVNIAIGSGAQIALFVAPVLVLASLVLGPTPMALVFNGYELAAILVAIIAVDQVVRDGESNWFEGFQLLALYTIFGVVFFFA